MVLIKVVGVVVWVVMVVVLGRFGKSNGQGCSGIGFGRCSSGSRLVMVMVMVVVRVMVGG